MKKLGSEKSLGGVTNGKFIAMVALRLIACNSFVFTRVSKFTFKFFTKIWCYISDIMMLLHFVTAI